MEKVQWRSMKPEDGTAAGRDEQRAGIGERTSFALFQLRCEMYIFNRTNQTFVRSKNKRKISDVINIKSSKQMFINCPESAGSLIKRSTANCSLQSAAAPCAPRTHGLANVSRQ